MNPEAKYEKKKAKISLAENIENTHMGPKVFI